MPTEESKLFKDWFDQEAAERLADQIGGAGNAFDRRRFLDLATDGLASLEMQERVRQFSDALAASLPGDKAKALRILRETLPPALIDCEAVTDGRILWPVGQFIQDYGLDEFDEAWDTMVELTRRFSAEFAIRPYVEAYPEQVFPRLLQLTSHPNPHIRRWCSEGIRPRLPWGRKLHDLITDPSPVWPILEALRDDEEKYVQKSVANHLNDLTKDHPDDVLTVLERWNHDATPQRAWIIKHGLRTLIKDGHPRALALVGIVPPKNLDVLFRLGAKAIEIGESLPLNLRLESRATASQRLLIDFAVHYVRKGNKTSEKVFKWKTIELDGGGSIELEKSHAFKPTSIRALYPGPHRVEIQINGERLAEASFELLPAS